MKENQKIKRTKNHGKSHTRLYKIWKDMRKRCYSENKNSKNYKVYFAKGILITKEWDNFLVFEKWALENGYQEHLSIDRENNDGNYEPDNCRWVEQKVQTRNTRLLNSVNTSGYRGVTFNKKTQKWRSQISVNKKKISIGYFKDIIECALSYDYYVKTNKLEHTINFP